MSSDRSHSAVTTAASSEPAVESDTPTTSCKPLLSRPVRIFALVGLILTFGTLLIPLTDRQTMFIRLSPGSAIPVADVLRVGDPQDTYRHLHALTVEVSRARVVDVLRSLADPSVRLIPFKGDLDTSPEVAENSGRVAAYAALFYLGLVEPPHGVLITDTIPGSPAHMAGLQPGEVVAVDGDPVSSAAHLSNLLRSLPAGTEVVFTVANNNGVSQTPVILEPHPEDESLSWAGVRIHDVLNWDEALVPSLSPSFSGPSAGLAFALETIDQLTPGDLTGGRLVAVTGTIDPAGHVGAISGAFQKVYAAHAVGADLMLVPTSNLEEASAAAHLLGTDMELVSVDSLPEALAVLGVSRADLVSSLEFPPRVGVTP